MRSVAVYAFLAMGIFLAAVSVWSATNRVAFLNRANHAVGRVLDPGPGGRHARIAFELPDGKSVEFQSEGLVSSVHEGQAVPVVYTAAAPAGTARVNWALPLFFMPLLFALLAAGTFLAALANRP